MKLPMSIGTTLCLWIWLLCNMLYRVSHSLPNLAFL